MDIKELNINAAKGSSKNHPWEYARAKIVCKILKNRRKSVVPHAKR